MRAWDSGSGEGNGISNGDSGVSSGSKNPILSIQDYKMRRRRWWSCCDGYIKSKKYITTHMNKGLCLYMFEMCVSCMHYYYYEEKW